METRRFIFGIILKLLGSFVLDSVWDSGYIMFVKIVFSIAPIYLIRIGVKMIYSTIYNEDETTP